MASKRHFCCPDPGDNPGKPSAEVGLALSDVVTADVEDCEDSVTDGALQGASGQAAIGFHVADFVSTQRNLHRLSR